MSLNQLRQCPAWNQWFWLAIKHGATVTLIPDAIGPDLVLVTLNTDFSVTGMSALEITALVAAWQAGAISQATMLDLFRAGEVIAPGRTNEEEINLLATQKVRAGLATNAPVAVTPSVPGDSSTPR
jgi:hypothetical protein